MDIVKLLNGTYEKPTESVNLLDKRCTVGQTLANDSKNVIRAVNVTLHPKWHGDDPKMVRQIFRCLTKKHVCNSRKGIYVEIHYEFTKAMVVHMHCIAIGRRTIVARLIADYRGMFGFCLVKEPWDLMGWVEYCEKDDVYPPSCYTSWGTTAGRFAPKAQPPKKRKSEPAASREGVALNPIIKNI